jgi:hypothetical protein
MKKFEIIETPDYILAVSDEEIKEGDYCLIDKSEMSNELKSEIFKVDKILNERSHNLLDNTSGWRFSKSYSSKIIAYRPKGNAPELDLPLLLNP